MTSDVIKGQRYSRKNKFEHYWGLLWPSMTFEEMCTLIWLATMEILSRLDKEKKSFSYFSANISYVSVGIKTLE